MNSKVGHDAIKEAIEAVHRGDHLSLERRSAHSRGEKPLPGECAHLSKCEDCAEFVVMLWELRQGRAKAS